MGINVTLRGGSGDMTKAVYDPNLDDKIAQAQLDTIKLSDLSIDTDLAMGAHAITINAGVLIDGKDVSALDTNINNVVTGTYTGDGAVSKAINTGLTTLKGVIIYEHVAGAAGKSAIKLDTDITCHSHTIDDSTRETAQFAQVFSGGSFHVNDGGSDNFPNSNGIVYQYIAWGI